MCNKNLKPLVSHPHVLQFDISFYGLPCEWLSLDAMDISGEMHLDVVSSHSVLAKIKHERHVHNGSHQMMILRA